MPAHYEIRADFDPETIIVYQAYSSAIALPALDTKRFVPPFSFNRMTWIKPSFLWMMARSGWGTKPNQEHVLAIRLKRSGWEEALAQAVLTSPEKPIYHDAEKWRVDFEKAFVHVQWDPERSIRGANLPHRSIQVGISRHIVPRYVEKWIVDIQDYTPLVRKMYALIQQDEYDKASKYLPKERIYPLPEGFGKHLLLSSN